jgi:hypothetical protein
MRFKDRDVQPVSNFAQRGVHETLLAAQGGALRAPLLSLTLEAPWR